MPYYKGWSPTLFWRDTNATHFIIDSLFSHFNNLCLKCIATHSIIDSFINIVSKVIIKYLYNIDKLTNKIMIMFSFLTDYSKYANISTSGLTLLTRSNKPSYFAFYMWKTWAEWKEYWMNILAHECCKRFSMPLQFFMCSSWLLTKLRPMMKRFFLNRSW